MDDDATASQPDLQMEDAGPDKAAASSPKSSNKSFKKKYRKMRIKFDHKMQDGEELHRREVRAIDTNKRLATEIDRLLDLLLDINDAVQIPTERRFDLSLPEDMPPELRPEGERVLDIDMPGHKGYSGRERPAKALRDMLRDVPHHGYAAAAELFPDVVADLEAGIDGPAVDPAQAPHPASFLTADDIDNYIWESDQRVAAQRRQRGLPPLPVLPTLAPKAQAALHAELNGSSGGGSNAADKEGFSSAAAASARDFALRNPTSVYNWLRKHAPKTFLQDAEALPAEKENGDESHLGDVKPSTGRGSRKSAGGSGGVDRRATGAATRAPSSKRGPAQNARGSKRAAAAHAAAANAVAVTLPVDPDESMDYLDDDHSLVGGGPATPTAAGHPPASSTAKGKRKRTIDDDPGYRPKGGSTRPTKKKRKSESGGGGEGPPASGSKKSRKSDAAAAAAVAHEDVQVDDID